MNRYLIKIIFILFLSSCGDKTGLSPFKKSTSKPTALQLVENGCYDKNSSSPVASAVNDLVIRFDKRLVVMREVNGFSVLSVSEQRDHFKSTPFRPHIMSEKVLESSRLKIATLFNSYISQERVSKRDWEDLSRELKRLQGLSLRWQAQRCSLKQMKNAQSKDLKSYIHMAEKEELFKCPNSKNCKYDFVKNLVKNSLDELLSLCEFFKDKSFCISQLNKSYDTPEVFYDYFMAKHKKRYDDLFYPSQKRRIMCEGKKSLKTMTLRIQNLESIINKSGLRESDFRKRINAEWGIKDELEIQLSKDGPYNVIASFKEGHLSFVNEDEVALMTLSNSLFGEQLIDVFTHELGHVFGFADCYIEFYDGSRDELVYYSVDKLGTNKMCEISSESRILMSYKKRLKDHFCKK